MQHNLPTLIRLRCALNLLAELSSSVSTGSNPRSRFLLLWNHSLCACIASRVATKPINGFSKANVYVRCSSFPGQVGVVLVPSRLVCGRSILMVCNRLGSIEINESSVVWYGTEGLLVHNFSRSGFILLVRFKNRFRVFIDDEQYAFHFILKEVVPLVIWFIWTA